MKKCQSLGITGSSLQMRQTEAQRDKDKEIKKEIKVIQMVYLVEQASVGAPSYVTLANPMDCSPPVSSVHGILQARILEWVAISYSRGSSRLRDRTCSSRITAEPPGKSRYHRKRNEKRLCGPAHHCWHSCAGACPHGPGPAAPRPPLWDPFSRTKR